ncbi:MAG: YraN family protein [Eubacteriales bacterium]|nr:YraN family protein [Eubacteriales bacterium]
MAQLINDRKLIGNIGEDVAASILFAEGYDILERQYRWKRGEADIICGRGNELSIVEVKTRLNQDGGRPADGVDADKMRRMRFTAIQYINKNKLFDRFIDFKVFEISINQIDNAF